MVMKGGKSCRHTSFTLLKLLTVSLFPNLLDISLQCDIIHLKAFCRFPDPLKYRDGILQYFDADKKVRTGTSFLRAAEEFTVIVF